MFIVGGSYPPEVRIFIYWFAFSNSPCKLFTMRFKPSISLALGSSLRTGVFAIYDVFEPNVRVERFSSKYAEDGWTQANIHV